MTKDTQAPVNNKNSVLWDFGLLAILISVIYFIGLGSYPLFTPDEGRYSEVAREMLTTGDFITPRLNGVVFLDKPILYYWLQASAIKLFGLNEGALRFWPALIGIWGCLCAYLCGRLLFNRRTGILSSLLLATSVVYYGAAHYANLDLEVAVLTSTSLLFFLTGLKTSQVSASRLWIYGAYVFAGLAFLTKGLIGLFFPITIIGSWILLLGKWGQIAKLRPLSGLIILVAIISPWFILAQKATPEFFHFFFYVQQISRFLSTQDFNSQAPGWFYFPIVLAGFLPWTLFMIGSLISAIRRVLANRQEESSILYLLLWVAFVFTFFSIPHSKTIGYILPVFPALALLTANYIDRNWNAFFNPGKSFEILMLPISFSLFALACFLAPTIPSLDIPPTLLPYLKAACSTFTAATLMLLYFFNHRNLKAMLATVFVSTLVFFAMLVSSAPIINQNSTKELVTQIKSQITPQDEIMTYYKYFQDLPIYTEKRITIVADWEDPGIPHNDNWLRELWYGKSFQDTRDWLITENQFWKRWNSSKRVYVFTYMKYFQEFKTKAKKRLYVLGQDNEIMLLSNQA